MIGFVVASVLEIFPMTQLLLFGAPSSSSFAVPAESSSASEAAGPQAVGHPRPAARPAAPNRRPQPCPSVAEKRAGASRVSAEMEMPARGGMHRMGDLANAVLARYEIVAKRRAALLARGPLPSVRY